MKFFGQPDDFFDAGAQAIGDEIGVAGSYDGAVKIVIARRHGVLDFSRANINAAVARVFGIRIVR